MEHSNTEIENIDRSFSRRYRLISAIDYKNVFKQPQKVSTPEFLFLFCKNERKRSRLGLAIAKKQIPHAVDRNRIKRLVRESFREERYHLSCIDIVVMGRNKLIKMDNVKIRSQLDSIWNKIIVRSSKPITTHENK